MQILSFFNQKGGVGKTTSALIFGDYLEKQNKKVLMIDLDQQASLSQAYIDYDDINSSSTLYDYFHNKSTLKEIIKTYSPYIDLMPSDLRLANFDFIDSTELLRKKISDFTPIFNNYDYVLIDCPPALNTFARLGIILSNYVCLPLIEEKFCYLGIADAVNTISNLKLVNQNFKNYFCFASKKKGKKNILNQNYKNIYKEELGNKLLKNILPDFIGIAERPDRMKNLWNYEKKKDKLVMIEKLCEEILGRIQ